MKRVAVTLLAAAALFGSAGGQAPVRSPGAIVATAPAAEWTAIAPEDLLVMTLAPDRDGGERVVYIQLVPPPFSEPWVANIRSLARAHWYDGLAVMRVQDNYVVQWGDPHHDNPASGGPEKPLPSGLQATGAAAYEAESHTSELRQAPQLGPDRYAHDDTFYRGIPVAGTGPGRHDPHWPIHCYGMIGVGHAMPPDRGTGGELYAVIGQAPRQLDRNLAVVGRVVEGMPYLSSLPRGEGPSGFYADPARRTVIESVRVASDLPPAERPQFEYLSTTSDSFARYVQASADRRDPFFVAPGGGADICNVPVPVRRVGAADPR